MGPVNWIAVVLAAGVAALVLWLFWRGASPRVKSWLYAVQLVPAAMLGHALARIGPDKLELKPHLYFMQAGGLALAIVIPALWLAQARRDAAHLAALPSPQTVLLVGGPTRHAALDDAGFAALLARLSAHAHHESGSFSVVASRRTPDAWRASLSNVSADMPGIRWRAARDGPNPYAGLLAHANRIACTPDSVNMLSEAAATLAPVFVWSADIATGRLRAFLDALRSRGRVRDLDDALAPFAVDPLRETARVASEVRRRLALPIA